SARLLHFDHRVALAVPGVGIRLEDLEVALRRRPGLRPLAPVEGGERDEDAVAAHDRDGEAGAGIRRAGRRRLNRQSGGDERQHGGESMADDYFWPALVFGFGGSMLNVSPVNIISSHV